MPASGFLYHGKGKYSFRREGFQCSCVFTTGNGEEAFSVKGNRYRGEMKIIPSAWNNGVTVVNRVPMELYLKGVVPSESCFMEA